MKLPCLPAFYEGIDTISAIVSICANILLIYLIKRRTSKELRVYTRVFMCTTVVNLSYSTTSFLIGPVSMYLWVMYRIESSIGGNKRGGRDTDHRRKIKCNGMTAGSPLKATSLHWLAAPSYLQNLNIDSDYRFLQN